jgi:YggT family protein
VAIVRVVLLYALYVLLGLLLVRLIVDWVMVFARQWRPTGVVAALLELAYTATDPPLRLLRRLIPPLRLGSFALDLAYIVLFFVVSILIGVVNSWNA